ncbi:MAG: PAS domain S-box protein [Desulfobacterales bacterium]|nr:PAS domain S-box protein [Desulfobacterales bacterium]
MKPIGPAKWVIIVALVATSALLTIYFQGFLGIETVFTHFFYIPIILGALWWGRAGMGVALLLGAVLLASHWFYRPDYSIYKDCFRAAILLVVSAVVVLLRSRIISTETSLHNQTKVLENRVRSLNCLYDINKLREKRHMPLGEVFLETIKLLERAFEDKPVKVLIRYEGSIFETKAVALHPTRIISVIEADGHPAGAIEAGWPESDSGREDFLETARQLVESVARRLGKIVEHEKVRSELDQHHLLLEDLVRERTEELNAVNSRLLEQIAERKKIETSLRDSEKQYRILIENADQAIFISQNNQIRFANPGLSALTGYPIESLLRMSLLDFIHPRDRDTVAANYSNGMAGEKFSHMIAFRIQTADETLRWVELDMVTIQWQGLPCALNFLRDITSRKRLEAAIGQIRKMEAIGVLAGGIAHQFNNALAGIIGNIDLLKLTLPDDPNVQRCGNTALQCAQSMAGFTQQLLAYARGGKYQSQPHSLNLLIKDVLHQVMATGNKRLHIDTSLSPDTPMVEVDIVQIRMVMLAVINNAAEAIGEDGHIRIETFRAQIDEAAAEAFTGLPPGAYAGLSIMDDGKGMTEEVKEHIFEPFFTTKFLGRGMGMAAAYGIVKNHGGYIYVDSEPGHGTVVHILLPPCTSL